MRYFETEPQVEITRRDKVTVSFNDTTQPIRLREVNYPDYSSYINISDTNVSLNEDITRLSPPLQPTDFESRVTPVQEEANIAQAIEPTLSQELAKLIKHKYLLGFLTGVFLASFTASARMSPVKSTNTSPIKGIPTSDMHSSTASKANLEPKIKFTIPNK